MERNKQLFNRIMFNISKEVKRILNEDIQNFDIADYEDNDMIDNQTVAGVIYKYHPKNKGELVTAIVKLLHRGIRNLNTIDVSQITDFSHIFSGMDMQGINISEWNVSNGKNFIEMFAFTKNFTCDLNDWNIRYKGKMQRMFLACESFTPDMIESWNLLDNKITDLIYVKATSNKSLKKLVNYFISNKCKNLNYIDVSQLTDFSNIFRKMYMENIDISDWDVSNGTNFRYMFYDAYNFNCSLHKWDVSNGTNFDSMFCGAKQFFTDLSTWDINPDTSLDDNGLLSRICKTYMFWGFKGNITALPKTLDTPNFSTSNANVIFGWAEFIENPHPEKMLGKKNKQYKNYEL